MATPLLKLWDSKDMRTGLPADSASTPKNSIAHARRPICLATRLARSDPPRPSQECPWDSSYLLFLLSSAELDAQEQQEEEEREAPGGEIPRPPPRLPPA